jgi:hypothetical protein
LSGGAPILGPWKLYDSEKQIWETPIPKELEKSTTRQLYVNGIRATRSLGFFSNLAPNSVQISSGYVILGNTIMKDWRNPESIEVNKGYFLLLSFFVGNR